jgi:hypothetical protein
MARFTEDVTVVNRLSERVPRVEAGGRPDLS